MIIGTVSENKKLEKRISITPEIAKKYISNGFEVMIEKDLATHLGIPDKEFLEEYANHYKKFLKPSGLADYGGINNLLECVSTYTHEVASINSANICLLYTSPSPRDS